MKNPRHIIWGCILSLFLVAQARSAGPGAREQAKASFQAGQKALAAEQYGDAIVSFEKAHQLAPHPAMLLNIARVYEAVDDLKNAIRFFKAYRKANPKAKGISQTIAKLRAKYASWPSVNITSTPSKLDVWLTHQANPPLGKTPLRLRMPTGAVDVVVGHTNKTTKKTVAFTQGSTPTVAFSVRLGNTPSKNVSIGSGTSNLKNTAMLAVNVDVAGAQVRINDRLVGITPLPTALRLTPGVHNLSVSAPNGATHEEVVNLSQKESRQVLVTLHSGSGSYSNREVLALSFMGIGGAAVVAAIATGIMALDANTKLDDCRSSACAGTLDEVGFADDVRSKAQLTDILLGCGIALSSAGTYLWLQEDSKPKGNAAGLNEKAKGYWDTSNVWSPKP
jgi:hypothetical protein